MHTIAIGIFVDVGSRDELLVDEWGAAHLLEHMVFKGAGPWDAQSIARRMDDLGGDINAYTTRDHTVFYAKVMADYAYEAWQLLRTLVFDPHLTAKDLKVERQVVLEERREALDMPEDRCEQIYMQSLYGDDPIAHDSLGSPQAIRTMSARKLRAFYHKWYRPDRICVAIAGRGSQWIVEQIGADLQQSAGSSDQQYAVRLPARRRPQTRAMEKIVRHRGEQIHWMMGRSAPSALDRSHTAMQLGTTILGGQNSSRLWQTLREQAGLAYNVYAGYSAQRDWGEVSLYMAMQPGVFGQALQLVQQTLHQFITNGPQEEEVVRARTMLLSSFAFSLESPEGRMLRLGWWGLSTRRPPSAQSITESMQTVTARDIQHVMEDIWQTPQDVAVVALGPLSSDKIGLRERVIPAYAEMPAVLPKKEGVIP